jgi:glycine oxidase
VALQSEELARLDDVVAPAWRSHGFDIAKMTREELRSREPLLSDQVLGGYLLKAEFALEPAVLMKALQRLIGQRPQATIRYSCALAALDVQSTECRAVLTDETVLSAKYLVLAVGRAATDFMQIPEGILFPVKGQAIELVAPGVTTYPLTYHCYAKVHDGAGIRSSYLVPRSDGRLVVGVTYEVGESDSIPTRAAYDRIIRGLADLVPAAILWPQTRHWAGVRPGIVDGIPIISPDPVHANLIYCIGHYGLGITLAPVSAEMVAVLVGEETKATGINEALRICSLGRFSSDH